MVVPVDGARYEETGAIVPQLAGTGNLPSSERRQGARGGPEPNPSESEDSGMRVGHAGIRISTAPEVPVDRSTGETVHEQSTEKLRVRILDLLRLLSNLSRKANLDLDGAGFPHMRWSRGSGRSVTSCEEKRGGPGIKALWPGAPLPVSRRTSMIWRDSEPRKGYVHPSAPGIKSAKCIYHKYLTIYKKPGFRRSPQVSGAYFQEFFPDISKYSGGFRGPFSGKPRNIQTRFFGNFPVSVEGVIRGWPNAENPPWRPLRTPETAFASSRGPVPGRSRPSVPPGCRIRTRQRRPAGHPPRCPAGRR